MSCLDRIRKGGRPDDFKKVYSAYGEDLLILSWLQHYGCDLQTVRYVDVGANHPTRLSNTFLLYQGGASGILIEPDPIQADLLRKGRPRDVVVNAGVAFDERREATLFRLTSNVFNTFSKEQADFVVTSSQNWGPAQRQEIVEEISVPLIPLNDLIDGYTKKPIHVLSIDAEGVDLAILRSTDLRFMDENPRIPGLICIEATASLADTLAVLERHGFEFMARTPDNWLFRRHAERFTPATGKQE